MSFLLAAILYRYSSVHHLEASVESYYTRHGAKIYCHSYLQPL